MTSVNLALSEVAMSTRRFSTFPAPSRRRLTHSPTVNWFGMDRGVIRMAVRMLSFIRQWGWIDQILHTHTHATPTSPPPPKSLSGVAWISSCDPIEGYCIWKRAISRFNFSRVEIPMSSRVVWNNVALDLLMGAASRVDNCAMFQGRVTNKWMNW